MEDESNKQTTWLNKKQKKRHIANSDTDSENSYPASQQTNSSSSTSTKKPYVPRFLIIHSEKEDKSISSLSPFLVHKTIMSLTGEPKSIKNLRSRDLLIQCAKEKQETTLLNLKNFSGLKCKVTTHSSLNISKSIVCCPALNRQTCEHILEFMGEQGVTDVRRISVFRDGAKKPTNTFVFTFNSPVLPSVVKIGFIVKCLATTKTSVADRLYASTAVCLSIAQLASVKDRPSV